MIRRLISWIARRLPLRIIAVGGDEYLRRYYVCGRLSNPEYFPEGTKQRLRFLPFAVFLHHFIRPDRDRELHNHPWDKSMALILVGGYDEKRRVTGQVWTSEGRDTFEHIEDRHYQAPAINVIRADDFHRVSKLYGEETWTLFITGRKIQTWGFRLDDGSFVPWREFLGIKEGESE